jgi:hypothetical protein
MFLPKRPLTFKGPHGFIPTCGGGLEYLHRSPSSSRRRREWNPVPGGITGAACHWRT